MQDNRDIIVAAELPQDFQDEILRAYKELSEKCGHPKGDLVVAIRSSATAEDLPNASFGGQ